MGNTLQELNNIRERLEKVVILVPASKSDAIQQLKDDCRALLAMIETMQREAPKESA